MPRGLSLGWSPQPFRCRWETFAESGLAGLSPVSNVLAATWVSHVRCLDAREACQTSATGTRTRVARVKAEYPSQLDYSGL